jgi:DNA mismatch repair ATPase MutS
VINHLREIEAAGYPMSFPRLLPADDRRASFRGLYNLRLASHWTAADAPNTMVFNDVIFDDDARIHVLTGPNGGGKTTFTQAVGMAVILGQNGFPVPARESALSPVDRLYTHFSGEEEISDEIGRFEDEAKRLSAIFDTITSHSMVLLNEPLASTGPHEAERIAAAVLGGLATVGVRGVFTTHYHRLAATASHEDVVSRHRSAIGTLNAGVRMANGKAERTYCISSGPPSGQSYADDIARQYGIDSESLNTRLGGRADS